MSDTYKGESWGKKLARLEIWSVIRDEMVLRGRTIESSRVACLAGRNAGDLRVLRYLGANPANACAVEREESAAESASAAMPGWHILTGDAFDLLPREAARRGRFDAIVLDFCSTMSRDLIGSCVRLARSSLRSTGWLTICCMYGRDGGDPVVDFLRSERATRVLGFLKRIDTADPRVSATPEAARRRAHALYLMTRAACERSRLRIDRIDAVAYHSRTERSAGVPMVAMTFRLTRDAVNASADRHKFTMQTWFGPVHKIKANVVETALGANPAYAGSIADALCVSPGTVAAWRAHATMGTYDAAVGT